jgi:hypothetical protein
MVEIMEHIRSFTILNHNLSNGKYHKLNGPCIIWTGGEEWWYFKGERIKKENHPFNIFCKEYNLSPLYDDWSDDMKMLFKLTYGGN